MPFDGSGNFNRTFPPGGWQGDAAGAIKIRADRHDQHDSDLAQGLSNAICRDGQSQVIADISFGGWKITDLKAPDDLTDAANKAYVDSVKSFSTGAIITGSDANGRLTFASPIGVNGISWTGADLFWGARVLSPDQYRPLIMLNSAADASGNDVIRIDEGGIINSLSGHYTHNASYDASGLWRTIGAGQMTDFVVAGSGLALYTNVTPTVVAYQNTTLNSIWSVNGASGATEMVLNKTGDLKSARITSKKDNLPRWMLDMGNSVSETGTNEGSDFQIYRFDDAGAFLGAPFTIKRSSAQATFSGNLQVAGSIVSGSAAQLVLGTNVDAGVIYFRPNGVDEGTAEAQIDANGTLSLNSGNMLWGVGGTGVVQKWATDYYWDWNNATGDLRWIGAAIERHRFYVNGNFQIFGSVATKASGTAWVSASDARIKNVTGDYETGLAEILQMTPRRFTYKGNYATASDTESPHARMAADGTEMAGFIAQEIEGAMPDLVMQSPGYIDGQPVEDFRSVDVSNLTYALVNAVKTLAAENASLKARLDALEAAA